MFFNSKKKYQNSKQRMEIMKELFLGIETEYYENNNATNIADLFNEMLRAIPLEKIVQNDTLALFKNELEELVNSRQLKISHVVSDGPGTIENITKELKNKNHKTFYIHAGQTEYFDVAETPAFVPDYINFIKGNPLVKVAVIVDNSEKNPEIAQYVETQLTKHDSPYLSLIVLGTK